MSSPILSVVLPIVDPDPVFFPQAVHSILGQTMPDFELLVIEDPSSASARDQLAGIEDSRLRLHSGSTPTSLVDQLNRGIRLARAPWVARMDGDDVALPERFERQLEFIEVHRDLDVVGTQIEIINSAGTEAGSCTFPTSHEDIVRSLRRYNPISHPTVLMRKATIEQAGLYQYPERAAQDYELWCRLAVSGAQFANMDQVLLRYRLHSGSIKSQRTRATLRATTAAKRDHWSGQLSLSDRALYWAERAAELLPGPWLRSLAHWWRYKR